MESTAHNQIVPQRKSLWKMVKTVFTPATTIARLMVGCGSSRRNKGKRRLTMRNMKQAKDIFIRASLSRASSLRRPTTARQLPASTIGPPPDDRTLSRHSSDSSEWTIPTPSPVALTAPPFITEEGNVLEENSPDPQTTSQVDFPAPLNIAEAQAMLDSLTISNQHDSHESIENGNENDNQVDTERDHETHAPLRPLSLQTSDTSIPHAPLRSMSLQTSETPLSEESGFTRDSGVYSMSRSVGNINSVRSSIQMEDDNHRTSFGGARNGGGYEVTSMTTLERREEPGGNRTMSIRRSRTTTSLASPTTPTAPENEFHGWRQSSVQVSATPPITLAYLPSGLLIGDRIVWMREDIPEIGTVKWIGKIRNQFYAGVEFDKPVGNSSGIYGYGVGCHKRLFTCQLPYGRFLPVKELILYKDYHDTGVKSGIVCIICRDDFLESWEPIEGRNDGNNNANEDLQISHMVSTKCGHLYHYGCLDQWFSTKKRNEFHCPFCFRPMDRSDVIRIFPSQI